LRRKAIKIPKKLRLGECGLALDHDLALDLGDQDQEQEGHDAPLNSAGPNRRNSR
jgi:hypothetical protein